MTQLTLLVNIQQYRPIHVHWYQSQRKYFTKWNQWFH